VLSLEDQAKRLWEQLLELPSDLARNMLLEQAHNRNEVLYFKVLSARSCGITSSPARNAGALFIDRSG
jgi:hypothetical protein